MNAPNSGFRITCFLRDRIWDAARLRASWFAAALLVGLALLATSSNAQEPPSLLTMIARWQYPGSKMKGAEMGDASTLNSAGDRTVQSIQYKTVLITKDPVSKVLDYYKGKLTPKAGSGDPKGKEMADFPRSVTFIDDTEGRPVAVHVILINSENSSTTIVISRAEAEAETHIAWTHYKKL